MALPPSSVVAEYRQAVADSTTLAHRDLLRAWREFDLTDAAKVRDGLLDLLPDIITTHHLSASTAAADFYDIARHDLGVPKRFAAVMAPEPDASASQALARWGVGPLFSGDPSSALALSKIAGGVQRLIANGARQTVTGSAHKDPARIGWMRVGQGECDWCDQYIDGVVHYVEGYDFQAHDRCLCAAVPAT